MRGFLAVFEREIVERRLLLLAALVLGIVPLLAPLMPGMPPARPAELRGGTALGLALALTLALALLLGGSVIGRDLVERRLGFYFARPLSGTAIWAGKMAGAAALTVGAGLLVLLPSTLLGGLPDASGYWGTSPGVFQTGSDLAVLWLGILLLALTAAHAVSVMVRSRSLWLLLDLVALGVSASVAGTCLLILARVGAGMPVFWQRFGPVPAGGSTLLVSIKILVGLVALLGLTVAGGVQVTRGRTDLRRGHRALSIALWSLLLPAALLFAGYTHWFLAPSPKDLASVDATLGSPASPWIAIQGRAAHRGGYRPGFLVDVGSGRSVRANFAASYFYGGSPFVRFSADGRKAVWLESSDVTLAGGEVEIKTLDLGRPGASPQTTRVALPGGALGVLSFALSPDGRRVAAVHDNQLTVDEIDSGRLLTAVHLKKDDYHEVRRLDFAGPDRVRVYNLDFSFAPQPTVSRGMILEVSELDVATGKLTTHRSKEQLDGFSTWTVGPGADRVLLRGQHTLQLRDGATGQLIAELGKDGARGSFLPDGRVAALTRGADGSDLRILDTAGTELRRFHFPAIRTVLVADQPGPQTVRVVTRGSAGSSPWQLWTLDLATGEGRPGPQLALTTLPFSGSGPWPAAPGRDGMVWLDPFNARETVVLRDGLPGR